MATTSSERVDEEINKCIALLSDLRAQKNSFLPIFRLLPETLANVFIHAAYEYWQESYGGGVPHWVNVSYVCRHWRNVALDCPMLWTYHFTAKGSRWTEELLARSKQALLKIRIMQFKYQAEPWWSRLLVNVLSQAGRIQELRLNILYDILPKEFSLNSPHLQILDIAIQRPGLQGSDFIINNGKTLPLRTLKLTNFALPWHSTFNLSGIKTLSLCQVPRLSQQNIVDFLATLNRMQALTVLQLEDALCSVRGFPISGGAFGVSTKVNLPHLARLLVRAPLPTVLALLSGMNLPSDTHVRLEIHEEAYDPFIDNEYAQFLPSVVAHRFGQYETLSSSSPAIRSLVVRFISTCGLKFTFSTSERGDCGQANLAKPYPPLQADDIPLVLDVKGVISNRDRIAGDICCSIPSTHVQTLHALEPPSSPDLWRTMLCHLDRLQYMKLSYGNMPNLVSLLSLSADAPVDAQTPRRTLHLYQR